MLQLRPTFSESWYRVVTLKPKLRGTAQISRQYYRGERWYVVRDPAGNQFHRLSDAAYRFVGLLDGRRTVGEAWDLVGGQLEDDAPTQPEVIQILSQLYAANLVETDIPPDATVLLRRHKQLVKRQMQGRLMNVLFPRIPIWDPDRFVKRWMPLARVVLSKLGAIVWLIVVVWAIASLAPHWADLKNSFSDTIDLHTNPENVFMLWVTFVLIKFIHECGHAFSCRRFGGEVHEMGIMFLVFIPTPYVDASTAWAFSNKWKRMFVGAAGMIVELFVAAVCAFIWLHTYQSGSLVSKFAFNAMLIASVTTVIFNANPLLRYDGYYILSDWLEIPNLQQKSRDYALGLIKRHIFWIKSQQPLPPLGQCAWLLFYGIASSIYRVWIGLMIIFMVLYTVPVIGILMAVGGVITWGVVPLFKLFKYLAIEPELHRKRGRAWAFTIGCTAVAVYLVGLINFPVRVRAEGILEPLDKQVLKARTPGFVSEVVARQGQQLYKGDVILVMKNPELDEKIKEYRDDVQAAEYRRMQAAQSDDQNEAKVQAATAQTYQHELDDAMRRYNDLTVRAPIDGELVALDIADTPGKYFDTGDEICTVQQVHQLRMKGIIDQEDAQLVIGYKPTAAAPQAKTEVRLVSDVATSHQATGYRIVPGATEDIPHPALAAQNGGDVTLDPKDQTGTKAQNPEFQLWVDMANPGNELIPGQRAYVRMTVDRRPLAWQWTRDLLQMIQSRKERGNELAKY